MSVMRCGPEHAFWEAALVSLACWMQCTTQMIIACKHAAQYHNAKLAHVSLGLYGNFIRYEGSEESA